MEFLVMVSGLEQQVFIPSLVFANGFRLNKQGWEVVFGPTLSLRKSADGFYDKDNLVGEGADTWYLISENKLNPVPPDYEIVERLDSRGKVGLNTGWIWGFGKTFRSGYLNIPVNFYVSPKKEGWYIGTSVGFNVSRKR